MNKSQLIQLLKSLNKKEVNKFCDYLNSPLYNKNERVVALFLIIRKAYPKYQASFLDKDRVAKQLYPKQDNAALQLRKLMTQLSKLLKHFLSLQQLEKHPMYQQHLLLEACLDRGLFSSLDKLFKPLKNSFGQYGGDMHDDYYRYFLMYDYYMFIHTLNNRTIKTTIQDIVYQFDVAYVLNKLRYCCGIFNRQLIFKEAIVELGIDELLSTIKKNNFLQIPVIEWYHACLQIFLHKEDDLKYQLLLDVFRVNSDQVSKKDKYNVFSLTNNYCLFRIRNGELTYWRESFAIYQLMLTEELLTQKGYMMKQTFENICRTAARLGKFEWGTAFIQQYSSYLREAEKKNVLLSCKGVLAFYEQRYHQALQLFIKVEFQGFSGHINNEMFLIKCYYELTDYALIEYRLESLRQFMKRNKAVSDSKKESYRNFINFMKRLLRVVMQKKGRMLPKTVENRLQKSLEKLKQDVTIAKPLVDKEWLLHKIDSQKKHK